MADFAFRLKNVRKTYGAKDIPHTPFRECRLLLSKDNRNDWRQICGTDPICRKECPKCWALYIDNMEIIKGKISAILGHSGSGKTTLLNLLALLDMPDRDSEEMMMTYLSHSKELAFNCIERQKNNLSANEIRKRYFGFVFQTGHLTSHLTAQQNVALSLALNGEKYEIASKRIEDLFEKISFPSNRFRALPLHLSGGEYQRVAVVRALANHPQFVFADEPTGNLDPFTGQEVMELLIKWQQEDQSRTLILVTHNIEHALTYSHHIVVLSGGRITMNSATNDVTKEKIEQCLRPPM